MTETSIEIIDENSKLLSKLMSDLVLLIDVKMIMVNTKLSLRRVWFMPNTDLLTQKYPKNSLSSDELYFKKSSLSKF